MKPSGAWMIRRTRPVAPTLGYAIPTFIHNWSFHLTTVDAFADGAIDAWGFLDLALFQRKALSGWIATAPPPGSRIEVFNLGGATVADCAWLKAPADILRSVEEAIDRLNPDGSGLLDMAGSDVELIEGVRHAQLGLSNKKPYRPDATSATGAEVPVFRRQGSEFALERWFVFSDGLSRVGADAPLESLEATLARVHQGELCTDIPDGSWVEITGLGSWKLENGNWGVEIGERIREVEDMVAEARGAEAATLSCIRALERYQTSPSAYHWHALKTAYDNVPEHLRMYCGDMDTKDWPIRAILTSGPPQG